MASLVTTGVVALTVAFLTPPVLPPAPHRARRVIVVAVAGLVDLESARTAWRVRRSDAAVLGITFAATLLIGVEPGIGIGVAVSLALLLWRTANPHTAELGRVRGTDRYRNTARYPTVVDPRAVLLRVDGPLYFANAKFVDDRVTGLVDERAGDLRRCSSTAARSPTWTPTASTRSPSSTDGSPRQGIALHLATVRGPVRDVLRPRGVVGAARRPRPSGHPRRPRRDRPAADSPLRRGQDERCPTEVY
jgi:sulfate permease, SulP family